MNCQQEFERFILFVVYQWKIKRRLLSVDEVQDFYKCCDGEIADAIEAGLDHPVSSVMIPTENLVECKTKFLSNLKPKR